MVMITIGLRQNWGRATGIPVHLLKNQWCRDLGGFSQDITYITDSVY